MEDTASRAVLTMVFAAGATFCVLQAWRGWRTHILWVDGSSADSFGDDPRAVSGRAAHILASVYGIVAAGCLVALLSVWV